MVLQYNPPLTAVFQNGVAVSKTEVSQLLGQLRDFVNGLEVGLQDVGVWTLSAVGGGASAFTGALPFTPDADTVVLLVPPVENSGPVTLTVNGGPVRSIMRSDSTNLQAGDLKQGQPVMLRLTAAGDWRVITSGLLWSVVMSAIRAAGVYNIGSVAGTGNAITGTLPFAEVPGETVAIIIPPATNTGPATLKLGSGPVRSIMANDSTNLSAGDLRAGQGAIIRLSAAGVWRVVGVLRSEIVEAIDIEAVARVSGDAALQGQIDAEEAARVSGDAALRAELGGQIDAAVAVEAAARIAATSIAGVIPLANVGGTPDAITADIAPALPGVEISPQSIVELIPASNNSGAATLNVGGVGDWPVQRRDGSPVQAGDIRTDRSLLLRRRSNTWRMIDVANSEPLPMATVAGLQAALDGKANTADLADVATSGAKADIGLENVDNTSDADKPISTAQQAALDGQALEDRSLWSRGAELQARTIGIATVPNLKVGLREVAPDEVDFALNVIRGRWSDNGLPWEADGRYSELALLPETIDVNGQEVVITAWSFNLCPLTGYYKETGAAWPVPGEGGFPEMVVKTEADLVTVYHKTGDADQPTYIEQPVEHLVDASRNTDVWRTNEMYASTRLGDGTFLRGEQIIQTSEVETAVKITGAADHAGGGAHGNEELQAAAIWLINGTVFDPADGVTYICKELALIQTTRLFNPGTVFADRFNPKGAPFMELSKLYTWDAENFYTIRHHVKELTSGDTLDFAFFGMLPIIRDEGGTQITHTAVREPYWLPEDVSVSGFPQVETTASRGKIWGDVYSGEIIVTEGWTDPSRIFWVRNAAQYNKLYASFFADGTYTMTGAEYDTEVILKVGIKE